MIKGDVMMRIRPAAERGHADHGWLKTSYSFSFNTYHDPAHMGFRSLRVINEDVVMPGQGFGMHGHRDMEIVTYVIRGALEHRDSLGNGGILRAGELQRMTAGTGIRHSEFNPSADEPVHLYQIWLFPERAGLVPSYEQKAFEPRGEAGALRLVASPDGQDGSLTIHQDAQVFLGSLEPGQVLVHALKPARHGWIQVVRGSLRLGGQVLDTSDGAAVSDEPSLRIEALEPAQVMLFDLV
jgi:redox-sensitive bicupin YhaK (pirin superfamily)